VPARELRCYASVPASISVCGRGRPGRKCARGAMHSHARAQWVKTKRLQQEGGKLHQITYVHGDYGMRVGACATNANAGQPLRMCTDCFIYDVCVKIRLNSIEEQTSSSKQVDEFSRNAIQRNPSQMHIVVKVLTTTSVRKCFVGAPLLFRDFACVFHWKEVFVLGCHSSINRILHSNDVASPQFPKAAAAPALH